MINTVCDLIGGIATPANLLTEGKEHMKASVNGETYTLMISKGNARPTFTQCHSYWDLRGSMSKAATVNLNLGGSPNLLIYAFDKLQEMYKSKAAASQAERKRQAPLDQVFVVLPTNALELWAPLTEVPVTFGIAGATFQRFVIEDVRAEEIGWIEDRNQDSRRCTAEVAALPNWSTRLPSCVPTMPTC